MSTKKDFQRAADLIKNKAALFGEPTRQIAENLFAEFFRGEDKSRFDETRFRAACR